MLNARIFVMVISQNSGSKDSSYNEMSLRINICWMPQNELEELEMNSAIISTVKKITDIISMKFFKLSF